MSRHSFVSAMRAVARASARAERDRRRAQARLEAARAKQRVFDARQLRGDVRQAKLDAKEAARQYVDMRILEAEALSKDVNAQAEAINTLLVRGLDQSPAIDLDALIKEFVPKLFDERPWSAAAPLLESYMPEAQGFLAGAMPGAAARFERSKQAAQQRFEQADLEYQGTRRARAKALAAFEEAEGIRAAALELENEPIRKLQVGLAAAEHFSVVTYLKMVVERSLSGEPDAVSAEMGYSPESRHLVVDLELPDFSTIPEETGYKYAKPADRIDPIVRPATKQRALYSHLICQASLKAIDTVFRGAPAGIVECITLNSMLDTIDPATGQAVRVCLVSVRITAECFRGLNLRQVQPEQCLKSLKASVSRSPAEFLPVKPLVELDMVDPRFVDTTNIMSGLEGRPNLMTFTPTEFEGLITNLFSKMGLDTRQTRPSRDGGVDCVAFDLRPVFGGKVVIQAKRYKNTVGVSAVRDLFGTVQNEGATKGILVTTSGYGQASYNFAKGKPLELIDGSNLLYMLAEHAELEARIVMPDDWVDRPYHGE